MGIPNVITDNPALFVGAARALLLLVVAFFPGLMTETQRDAILAFLVASLALSAITVKTTVPKTPSTDATAASIQAPVS